MNSKNNFYTALAEVVAGQISGIHTASVGKIVSYDSGSGLAVVKPSINYKTSSGDIYEYPAIVNVPVFFPTGGSASITYPIKAGDDCCLIFAERSLDDWISGGETLDPRKYDLTDCMAFVGMKPSRSTNNDAIEIKHGGCTFSMPENGPILINTDVIINGISFLDHVHGGVVSGGAKTSTPE